MVRVCRQAGSSARQSRHSAGLNKDIEYKSSSIAELKKVTLEPKLIDSR
ncbi:MAG: hypothetical protein H7122_19425 [Chitinophagaceae bacterium]|nr:hypothetical protein [Chitinophagaceae bacterium]